MNLRALSFVAVVVAGCITTVNPVKYDRFTGAPVLQPRGEGCYVDIVEDGTKFTKPYKEMGTLVLDWSANQMKEQGSEYALKTLRTAACEEGAHAVIHMRALPKGFNEGMLYEGVLVVLLDENGDPLAGKSMGTSASHSGTAAPDPATATATATTTTTTTAKPSAEDPR
ncbi:MAG: hypothetical protein Q8O67_26045 [Deltaproteobacteria bacterium]|nr:hypothetical protein [Deltaproteobacteria bacterium]